LGHWPNIIRTPSLSANRQSLHSPNQYETRENRGNTEHSYQCQGQGARMPTGPFLSACWLPPGRLTGTRHPVGILMRNQVMSQLLILVTTTSTRKCKSASKAEGSASEGYGQGRPCGCFWPHLRTMTRTPARARTRGCPAAPYTPYGTSTPSGPKGPPAKIDPRGPLGARGGLAFAQSHIQPAPVLPEPSP
jgi:hypothetical protein